MKVIKYLLVTFFIFIGGLFVSQHLPFFYVHTGDRAILIRSGRYVRSVSKPGIYYKVPFADYVIYLKEIPEYLIDDKGEPITCDKCKLPISIYDNESYITQHNAVCGICI